MRMIKPWLILALSFASGYGRAQSSASANLRLIVETESGEELKDAKISLFVVGTKKDLGPLLRLLLQVKSLMDNMT